MSSRIREIAKQDLAQVRRHRLLWASFALVSLLMLPSLVSGRQVSEIGYNYRTYGVLLAAVLSVNAVVGERASDRVRLLLSLPGSRRDVFVGKLTLRIAVYLVVLLGLMALVIVALLFGSGVALVPVLSTFLWMGVYGAAWVGFAVGSSAAFDSWFRAAATVLITYVTFEPNLGIWDVILLPLLSFPFTGQLGTGAVSSVGTTKTELWYQYVGRLNPINAFMYGSTADVFRPLPNLFGVLVLLAFGAIPAYIGYRRFEAADLG